MTRFLFLFSALALISCKDDENKAQKIKIDKYEQVFNHFTKKNDTLYVVNFWATWCAPCVEEMPNFTKANETFKDQKFKMILVSLDRAKDFETKMKPFLTENSITADTYLLDDNTRMNTWIPLINKQWDGKIPVTAFYKKGEQIGFVPNTLNYETLEKIIKQNL